jgi:type 1 glutamine amidotransferase
MNKLITGIAMMLLLSIIAQAQSVQKRILVFSKTTRYHHESIPAGMVAIQHLGKLNGFEVDTTTNAAYFTEDSLNKYAAIVFLSTSGNLLDTVQKTDFRRYIEAGGGYVGIHSASASEKEWIWYGQLVGAVFSDHPEPQSGVVVVADAKDPSTKNLPARWGWKDEWYNFKEVPHNVHVLLMADETTYKGGKNGAYHPLAWYNQFDGGRAFYTALGHFDEAYSNPLYLGHILAGIEYAIGNHVVLNYTEVKTPRYHE